MRDAARAHECRVGALTLSTPLLLSPPPPHPPRRRPVCGARVCWLHCRPSLWSERRIGVVRARACRFNVSNRHHNYRACPPPSLTHGSAGKQQRSDCARDKEEKRNCRTERI
eukprot:1576718-Pleurochrysis_carterae.AAC.4